MGTRSCIALEDAGGRVRSVYCHWDGYPEHDGRILLGHYSEGKLRQLLDLGALSSLGPELGTTHSFDSRPDGECTFYGRDRGETGVEAKEYTDVDALADHLTTSWCEWLYIMRGGVWFFAPIRHGHKLRPADLRLLTTQTIANPDLDPNAEPTDG